MDEEVKNISEMSKEEIQTEIAAVEQDISEIKTRIEEVDARLNELKGTAETEDAMEEGAEPAPEAAPQTEETVNEITSLEEESAQLTADLVAKQMRLVALRHRFDALEGEEIMAQYTEEG